jgi:hypothetical protein
MRCWLSLALVIAACGGHSASTTLPPRAPDKPLTAADRILPLLPDGAQVVVELDLARLRANQVVGSVATRALERLGADSHVPGLPFTVTGSPLGGADAVVYAVYGVGSDHPATIMILATHADVPGGVRLTPDFVALGPEDWVSQVAARSAINDKTPLTAPAELLALRDHAMPKEATGAIVRVTARLPFDARIAFAQHIGLEMAPARLSLWADIADDLAIVVDADAADPGDHAGKDAARRLAHVVRGALNAAADDPMVRTLGVPNSLADAHLIAQGTWVRAIIAIGPRHLARAVERATQLLQGPS